MKKITLSNRYEVDLSQKLQSLSTTLCTAYAATDLEDAEQKVYCLKTCIFPPPRYSLLETMTRIAQEHPQLMMSHLKMWDNIKWDESSHKRSIGLILQRSDAPPLITDLDQKFPPWDEEKVTQELLHPIVQVLKTFAEHKITHQALRLTNIYYHQENAQCILGEGISMPPGHEQPTIFTPPSYAAADPAGRGPGHLSHDLYALGVTVTCLLNGFVPYAEQSSDQIIGQKIEIGSAQFLTPQRPISGIFQDLLRGLLCDHDEERWNISEVQSWLADQKQIVVPFFRQRKAARPFHFNDKKNIQTTAALSYEMRLNPTQANVVMERNELVIWLKNSLRDQEKVAQLERFTKSLPSRAGNDEKLLGILKILDPTLPFYWQSKSFTEGGIGGILVESLMENTGHSHIKKLLSMPLLSHYVSETDQLPAVDKERMMAQLSVARSLLEHDGFGAGIERCVYLLYEDCPCLSPVVQSYNVHTIPQLLQALDHLSQGVHRPSFPMDRHIAAFIVHHDSRLKPTFLRNVGEISPAKNTIAILKLFADLQTRHDLINLPGLYQWFVDLSTHVIDQYHNRNTREVLQKRVQATQENHQLEYLLKLLDNPAAQHQDRIQAEQACRETETLNKNLTEQLKNAEASKHYSWEIGEQNAMSLASVLSILFIFTCLIVGALA